jgi:hypothetical protein
MQSAGGAVANARDVDRWMRSVFGGKVVPLKQQQEWTELVSTKTGEPIATLSADDPAGFGLGIACKIFGSLGAQWFYQGESLGYRTLYFWIADQDLMITVQTSLTPSPRKAPTSWAKLSIPCMRSSGNRRPTRLRTRLARKFGRCTHAGAAMWSRLLAIALLLLPAPALADIKEKVAALAP